MVIIEMENGGVIKLELDAAAAPNTVKNFLCLADKGYYDGLNILNLVSSLTMMVNNHRLSAFANQFRTFRIISPVYINNNK